MKTLLKVLSMAGKLMALDGFTREKKRTAYARVLVEVDTTKPLVLSIHSHLPNGELNSKWWNMSMSPRCVLLAIKWEMGLRSAKLPSDIELQVREDQGQGVGTLTKVRL